MCIASDGGTPASSPGTAAPAADSSRGLYAPLRDPASADPLGRDAGRAPKGYTPVETPRAGPGAPKGREDHALEGDERAPDPGGPRNPDGQSPAALLVPDRPDPGAGRRAGPG